MIWYNGKPFSDFEAVTDQSASFEPSIPDMTEIIIPGRDGSIHYDNERFSNVDVTYSIFWRDHFKEIWPGFISWLMQDRSYHKLRDSAHENMYREAMVLQKPSVTTGPALRSATVSVVFNCMPFWRLDSGDRWKAISSGTKIINPTLIKSKPLIRVVGSGMITVGNTSFTIAGNSYGYIDIDSEIMDCFSGASNCNSLMSGDFPVIGAGLTTITFTGFSSVKIKPRWRTL